MGLFDNHSLFLMAYRINFHVFLPGLTTQEPIEKLLYAILPNNAPLVQVGKFRFLQLLG
jgi:hypothetical protein